MVIITHAKEWDERLFYIQYAFDRKLSIEELEKVLKKDLYHHQGQIPNNFLVTIPEYKHAYRAIQMFKDEYLLDFINVEELGMRDEDIDERVIEQSIVHNVKNFIMTFGKGFTFNGSQVHYDKFGHDHWIDLLFYNRDLRRLVVFELKKGKFKTAYLGQLSSYLRILNDDVLRNGFADEFDFAHLKNKKRTRSKAHRDPCVLYNGMLHSVAGYTAKGFVWYQGCANVANPSQYRRLQPAFVQMLRSEWQNEHMPFYYTQLAPHKSHTPDMMWIQSLNSYEIPNSAMATTHDIGDYTCGHPANKKDLGDRLSYLALTRDYGMNVIDAMVPMPIKYEYGEGEAIVTFNVGPMGLSPRTRDLDGFELAGEDGV